MRITPTWVRTGAGSVYQAVHVASGPTPPETTRIVGTTMMDDLEVIMGEAMCTAVGP